MILRLLSSWMWRRVLRRSVYSYIIDGSGILSEQSLILHDVTSEKVTAIIITTVRSWTTLRWILGRQITMINRVE
jgi:hypothetical protein